jgi:hypothetical protein
MKAEDILWSLSGSDNIRREAEDSGLIKFTGAFEIKIPKTSSPREAGLGESLDAPYDLIDSCFDFQLPTSEDFLKSTSNAPFSGKAALQRHTASTHTCHFICVFSFAGCASTFASKKEWKRHVYSQHLNLSVWVCELDICGGIQQGFHTQNVSGLEFNRKDLFTQHLRSMHAPSSITRAKKTTPDWDWEEQIKELQISCLRAKTHAHLKLRCPVEDCGAEFQGEDCWDERMDHVAWHLERAAASLGVEVKQENDELLVSWALQQRIIEPNGTGGFRLCDGGQDKVVDEYEDEDEDSVTDSLFSV